MECTSMSSLSIAHTHGLDGRFVPGERRKQLAVEALAATFDTDL